jgi:hypothetical protein
MIDDKKLIDAVEKEIEFAKKCNMPQMVAGMQQIKGVIERHPKVFEWIPVTYRETTDEDGIDKEIFPLFLDCRLPDNYTEILVCTKDGRVCTDTFFDDDGCYLDSGYDFIYDIAAWMPIPEPYKHDETV